MFDPESVRCIGPLKPYLLGFFAELMRQGYAPLSGSNLLRVAAHVSRWLNARDLGPSDLTAERVAHFMAHRRRRRYTQFLTPCALRSLLRYLCSVGVHIPSAPPAKTPLEDFLHRYQQYLASERGLSPSAAQGYVVGARKFAFAQFGRATPKWKRLQPACITGYVLRQAREQSVGSSKLTVTTLRSLLRFLYLRGHIPRDLTGCVPAVAGWRLSSLPKALEPDQAARLLRCCNARSSAGLRDRAIIHLLVRLGLRAGEVAALELDDINWRTAELRIRGKGREIRLPLPQDVGTALAAYLRRRPRVKNRRVFLRVHAPIGPLRNVIAVARTALRRIGIAGGAHLLRHTAATQMLRGGASLSEIGHALGHRHVDTTAIYAKVDLSALRSVTQPWPGGAL